MKWDADIETEAEAIAEAVANAGQMNKQQWIWAGGWPPVVVAVLMERGWLMLQWVSIMADRWLSCVSFSGWCKAKTKKQEQRARASGVLIYGGTNIIVSLIILQTIKLNNNKNNSERQYLCNTKNN